MKNSVLAAFLLLSACAATNQQSASKQTGTTSNGENLAEGAQDQDAQAFAAEWKEKAEQGDFASMQSRCQQVADNESLPPDVRAEACICLAVIAIQGTDTIASVQPSGVVAEAFDGPLLADAVKYLKRGIAIAPKAFAPRRELINVYMHSVGASEKLLAEFKGAVEHHHEQQDLHDHWLPLVNELYQRGQLEVAVETMKASEPYYPNNDQVAANMGAFLMLLNRDKEALPYIEKSIKLNPKDPINMNNLGEWYARNNQISKADKYFQQAIDLAQNNEEKAQYGCDYAQFVAEKVKKPKRAKQLKKKYCQ